MKHCIKNSFLFRHVINQDSLHRSQELKGGARYASGPPQNLLPETEKDIYKRMKCCLHQVALLHASEKAKKSSRLRTREWFLLRQSSSTTQRMFPSRKRQADMKIFPLVFQGSFSIWLLRWSIEFHPGWRRKLASLTFQQKWHPTMNRPNWSCQIPWIFIGNQHPDCASFLPSSHHVEAISHILSMKLEVRWNLSANKPLTWMSGSSYPLPVKSLTEQLMFYMQIFFYCLW